MAAEIEKADNKDKRKKKEGVDRDVERPEESRKAGKDIRKEKDGGKRGDGGKKKGGADRGDGGDQGNRGKIKDIEDKENEEDNAYSLTATTADAAVMTILQRNGSQIPALFVRDILLMHTMINGAMHVANIHQLAAALKTGDHVELILEPDNPVDEMAILVRNEDGRKLGYIPRARNEVLYHLMDAGKYLYGIITGDDIGENLNPDNPWVRIFIDVYMKD